MADLSWSDLLSDSTRYPDAMLWTLEDGSQIALGTLRQTLKGSFVPASEHENTRRQHQQREYEWEVQKRTLEQQLIDRLSAPTPPPTPVVPDVYQTDPLFKPIWDKVEAQAAENASLKGDIAKMNQTLQQVFGTVQQLPVVLSVWDQRNKDPELQGPDLLDFAREHQFQPHRLDEARLLMTRERDIGRARDKGIIEGYEKAKQELAMQAPQVPYAPFGPPQVVPNAPPSFETDQALEYAIMNDPEIYQVYTNQA